MGSLQFCVLILVVLVTTFHDTTGRHCRRNRRCGCVLPDYYPVEEKDYIYEPIRSIEFQTFQRRLYRALRRNWVAFVFLNTFPDHPSSDPCDLEIGSPLCETEARQLLGFWRDEGHVLCVVVRPEAQNIIKANCKGQECCGANTRCQPSVFTSKKYLVYCDAYYWENDTPRLPADTRVPEEMELGDFEEDELVPDTDPNKRQATTDSSWVGYFAFRHDAFPQTCSCRRCGSCSS